MTGAGPGADPTGDVVVARPRRTIMLALCVSAFLCGGTVLGWLLLPGEVRELFRVEQILTLLALLAFLVAAPSLLAASSVRADTAGLRIRNGPRVHRLTWDEVADVRLRPGDPWARAVLHDPDPTSPRPDHVMMMGLQAVDGARCTTRLTRIRRLLAQSRQAASDPGHGRG